ncbi:MAG: hypothetical protein LUB83_00090 [Prevotellaceae bacterium]|nr:hypothetical protein [Prevotellaceae bacterium]
MDLNELAKRAHETAVKHGFYDNEVSERSLQMLVITELAEAVNADRKNRHAKLELFNACSCTSEDFYKDVFIKNFEEYIKDTVEDELTDAVVRLLDYAVYLGYTLNGMRSYNVYGIFVEDIFGLVRRVTDTIHYMLDGEKELHINILLNDIIELLDHISDGNAEFYINTKMKYNEFRPYKHGKSY